MASPNGIVPHMISAVGKFDRIQQELARLADKSWYELFAELPCVPYSRSSVPQGTVERALEDRPRRTSNLSAPHELLACYNGSCAK